MFSRSLGMLMGALFLLTWAASSVAGWAAFNNEQLMSYADPVTWLGYLGKADFWNRRFQNWQSEMLAVGSMAIFTRLPAAAGIAGVQAGRRSPRRRPVRPAEPPAPQNAYRTCSQGACVAISDSSRATPARLTSLR